jgi:hypothetical protein
MPAATKRRRVPKVSARATTDSGGTARAGDARAFRVGSRLAIAAGAALLAITLATGGHGTAAVLAGFLVLGAVSARLERTVPPVATFVFASAVVYAGAGWAFDLFHRVELFDESSHVLFGFALTPVLAFVVLGPWLAAWPSHRLRLAAATVALGLAAGAAWEMAEWLVRLSTGNPAASPSLNDAITDMMLGGIGSVASLVTVWWATPRARAP